VRARNLKPSFFKNEILGSSDPLHSILFAGLWCSADREGRLEDRPLRLCVEIFPYRREITEECCDGMLGWLAQNGFIRRYEVGPNRYIQVLQFAKHQRPHSKEKQSEIPSFNSKQHRPRSGKGKGKGSTQVVSGADLGNGEHALTPDSGDLTPDSPLRGGRTQSRPRRGPEGRGRKGRGGKTLEQREAELRAKGYDPLALPGEPGYPPPEHQQ
jgi:hypothetical protein